MTLYDFIFTKKQPQKYYRHIAFWVAQFLFWTFWAAGFFYKIDEFILDALKFHGFFLLDMGYTYTIVYFLVPGYFERKRYVIFGGLFIILTLVTYLLFMLYLFWLNDLTRAPKDEQLLSGWYFSMNFIINGPPVICAMFLTFRMLKNFYIKMEEKQTLTKENTNAELQLLKAQVHPHFLFNTLNNIYSFALNKSPEAGDLVLKLKNTIRYMVYDCEAELVPLEKEIKMIEDYLGLEQVRYGNRLNLQVEIKGYYQNKLIAPLLLIPFVENSFKHGSSKMLQNPWIKIGIYINDNALRFELSNSKPHAPIATNSKKGIGLKNVQKRLALLYPNQYKLNIHSSNEVFFVEMELPLLNDEKQNAIGETTNKALNTEKIAYA